jgi:hypothetical protein
MTTQMHSPMLGLENHHPVLSVHWSTTLALFPSSFVFFHTHMTTFLGFGTESEAKSSDVEVEVQNINISSS